MDLHILENQIAIKTSKVDDLKDRNLLSRDCPVRYIITVNALKEGWDCPFAYILASLANKTSQVDVEQILGRVLRQPYAKRQNDSVLNISYVLTCSADFRSTLDSVVKGLNGAGFSSKDYRIGSMVGMENQTDEKVPTSIFDSPAKVPEKVSGAKEDTSSEDAFLEGFSLEHEDAHVAFFNTPDNMYTVDLSETGEAVPQYKMTNRYVRAAFRESLEAMPDKQKLQACINSIASAISRYDNVKDSDVRQYLKRVFGGLTEDEVSQAMQSINTYGKAVEDKIRSLQDDYRKKTFERKTEIDLTVSPLYNLPKVITPAKATSSIPKSPYEAEANDMNNFEWTMANAIAQMDNVKWWHRNIDRKEFFINEFINHYPDFIVMTKTGRILMVETKGDQLLNEYSRNKLFLGRKWANMVGTKYRYFMVFESKDPELAGAYNKEDFLNLLKKL